MSRKAKSLLIASSFLAVGCANAQFTEITPYIGADYQHVWMKGKNTYAKLFPKSFPGTSLYLGAKFHESFSLEFGFDSSTKKKQDWTIAPGSIVGTTTIGATQSAYTGSTKLRRSGGHIDLLGLLPVAESFDLFASAGFGWIKPKISFESVTGANTRNTVLAITSINGKNKGTFRLGIGGRYMVTDMVGVRAKAGWETTNSLRVSGNQNFTNVGLQNKAFKDSITVSLGAFVKF